MTMARTVATVPPNRPSTLLFGLIQARSGVFPAALPSTNAPTSLATTPIASRHNVSVPILVLTGLTGHREPGALAVQQDQRRERTEEADPGDAQRGDRHVRHRGRFERLGADERDGPGDEGQRQEQRQGRSPAQ